MAINNTIFDDVFRTMIEKMPELVIPLINEVFGTDYPADGPIIQQRNEHQTDDGEIITDSNLCLGNLIYHIECQSTSDSTMIIRMVQYDFSIAMDHAEMRDGKYYMEFPQSCVLYLRGKNDPKFLEMVMVMPDGRKVEYQVPVVHVQAYTKDEIFQKKLIFLLPFYIMRYRSGISGRNVERICRYRRISGRRAAGSGQGAGIPGYDRTDQKDCRLHICRQKESERKAG